MENEIKEFFRQTAPKPADPISFTLELNARLAAVEQIKAYRDREIRRTRRVFLIIFVAGLLVGGALAAFLILHPLTLPEPGLSPEDLAPAPWRWAAAGAVVLGTVLAAFLLTRHRTPLLPRI